MEFRLIGAREVGCTIQDLAFYHYINPLTNQNMSTYKGSFNDKEFPLEFFHITDSTKDPLSAFMQCCTMNYRRYSFRDKQRFRRIMHKWLWRSGALHNTRREGRLAGTEFEDIESVKEYFKIIENGEMEAKYLQLLSLIFQVDIIMIEPFSDNFIHLIGTGGNDCICILNMENVRFVPVKVNGCYYHIKGNDLVQLRQRYGSKQASFRKLPVQLKETEDIRANIQEIQRSQGLDYDMEDIKKIDDHYADGFYKMLYQIAPILF
jgi:hypothetical protein